MSIRQIENRPASTDGEVKLVIAFARNLAYVSIGLGMFAATMTLFFTEHFVMAALMFIVTCATMCTYIEGTI